MTGTTIAHYRVLEKLGEGGMGAVYKAEDTRLNRMVALKFLSTPPGESDLLESRFLHEARAAAALDHPNIVGIYEINVADGRPYLAMPLIHGESLEKRIASGPRPLKEAVVVAIQTAEALEEAHSKSIVHRDIKPGNILIVERDRSRLQVKLLDFGLARLNQATKLTREGTQLGTAAYMSPEQVEGSPVDLRSDVWSLGVVLYEMVSGQVPFPAEYEQALFYGIINEQPQPLTAVRSGVPMELERIVNKCLAKSPNQRYPSMADLLVDLNALLETVERPAPSRRSTAAPPPEAAPAAARKNKAPQWVWLLAGLPLGALAMWALWPAPPAEAPHTDYAFERVTWDGQFNGFPALSPDGALLAFASDRAGRGDLDIWIKQVKGGSLVRLTDDADDELQPAFSPDGSQIVFYRWGKGIFTIPALGGAPYLIAEGAGWPSFSPDGKRLAYIKDDSLYVSPVSMGEPKLLLSRISVDGDPLWTPDGEYVLLPARVADGDLDWWAVPEDGSERRGLGAREHFQKTGRSPPVLEHWSWLGDSLLFETGDGDLATIGFDMDAMRLKGAERLLTIGAGIEILPSASRQGAIAFMNAWQDRDVWALPLTGGGEPESVTKTESNDTAGDLSADGKRMVYLSNRWGQRDIWTYDFETGQNLNLTSDDAEQQHPILSRDGSRVAYMTREGGKDAIYVRPFTGGIGRKLCDDCGPPRDWSPDGKSLLFDRANPPAIGLLQLDSGESSDLLSAPDCRARLARYAPGGHAIVFDVECDDRRGGLFAALASGPNPISRDAWVEISSEPDDSYPAWSPDGGRLYYLSRREGSLDIWTQRIDAKTLSPTGGPEVVRRFPFARYSLDLMSDSDRRLSIAGGRLVFTLSEAGGSVWLMTPKTGPQ